MHWFLLILAVLGPRFLSAKVITRNRKTEHYCHVREEEFSYRFDFMGLTNENEDFVMKHDRNVSLRLQLCRELKEKCNGLGGYAICLSKHGQEVGIGKEPPEVVKEFGQTIFKYTGEKCDNSNNYTVEIRMICDFAIKDGNGVELYATGYNDCKFDMNWRTQAACNEGERRQINCTVDDKSGHYDLTQLINLSSNYEVPINDRYSIILNICHSILYGQNTCRANNGACLIDSQSEGSQSKGLGQTKENLLYNSADGTLLLNYTDGAVCNYKDGPSHMETRITFICDLNAIGTLPQYVGGMESCRYNIAWRTSAACSEKALHDESLKKKTKDCIVKDRFRDHTYNLTSLRNKEFKVNLFGTTDVYKFSVCGPLTNTTCKPGTGACRIHKSISGGIANSELLWKESGPYLNYTNGDLCLRKQQRYTIIEFDCSLDNTDDTEIEENDLCYDVIKISTGLVCNMQKKSCATFKNEVDFQELIQLSANYMIKTEDAEYHINVCRPLVPDKNLNCSNGAAICKTTIIDGKRIDTINLGYPDESPILSSDQSAVLIYRNGSVCKDDNKRKIESSISFLCDANSDQNNLVQNNLKLKEYNNCTYMFEWKTDIMCRQVDGIFHRNCSINNEFNDYRDLSVLFKDHGPVIPIRNEQGGKTYKMSLCGDKKSCNGAFVCDDEINYGTKISILYDYSRKFIRLKFTDGSKCSDGSVGQSIWTIICTKSYLQSEPDVLWESPCRVEFEWRTNKICKTQAIYTNEIVPTTKSSSLNGGEIAGIVIIIFVILTVACYLQNASRRSRLIHMISNSTTRNFNHVKYSRVNTMEEVQLLLNASDVTVSDSDSNDDLLEA